MDFAGSYSALHYFDLAGIMHHLPSSCIIQVKPETARNALLGLVAPLPATPQYMEMNSSNATLTDLLDTDMHSRLDTHYKSKRHIDQAAAIESLDPSS